MGSPERKPSHHLTSGKLRKFHEIDLFRRAGSALANHRPHRLSDIREMSGSSRSGTVKNISSAPTLAVPVPSAGEPSTPLVQHSAHTTSGPSMYATPAQHADQEKTQSNVLASQTTSSVSLPVGDGLERGSSLSIFSRSLTGSHRSSSRGLPKWRIPPVASGSNTVPNRGRADSPVRRAVERSSQSSEAARGCSSPLKTIIRTTPPLDILDRGSTRHDRLQMSIHLQSPLFVGGGTIEGQLFLDVDKGSPPRRITLKPLMISRLSIDVIGVEEINDGRRWVFLALGTEVFDQQHPPPPSIVQNSDRRHGPELSWMLKAGSASLPFCLNLPLKLGPPPYLSKQASIRYLLVPSAYVQSGDKQGLVRSTWNIQMLTVYDPEKALASLPNPLLAADTLVVSHTPDLQSVKLTAGLHRQTWVNGGKIFVDVHVVNQSAKMLKKLEIQLEKSTLWYAHAAAGTVERSANHLRLPKRTDFKIVGSTSIRKGKDWRGIPPYSSEVRTCELDVPRDHVTISTGRYFEVRFFVNVIIYATRFRNCAVQLPVTLIHMNSLDILPNSLAQVAASIEAKRARTVPLLCNNRCTGRAVMELGRMLSVCSRKNLKSRLEDTAARTADIVIAIVVVAIQVSTSGLGFSESEFEIPADSPPRKVMLSEQERKMINQQKE
ncbi:hypothetical protein DV738_g2421, partial [Chaetothyriales sp. CBS 135597]